jgi:hypothetical protein
MILSTFTTKIVPKYSITPEKLKFTIDQGEWKQEMSRVNTR